MVDSAKPTVPTAPAQTTARIDAERAAVTPLTANDVILDYYRKLTTPDVDKSRFLYRGIVIKILEASDNEYDVRDPFYDSITNQDRIGNNTKTRNVNKKTLFVHVPFFITNNRVDPALFLHYDTFNKIRISHETDEVVKIGSIVTIQFADKDKFTQPSIMNIVETDIAYVGDKSQIIQSIYKESIKNVALGIKPPEIKELITFTEKYRPGGGYKRALYELNSLSNSNITKLFIESITGGKATTEFGNIANIKIKISDIYVVEDIAKTLSPISINFDNNITINILDKKVTKDYLMYVSYEISCDKQEQNSNLRQKYFEFLKNIFYSKLYFSLEQNKNIGGFSIDLNLDEIKGQKNLKTYLELSEIYDASNFNKVFDKNIAPKSSQPKIIEMLDL